MATSKKPAIGVPAKRVPFKKDPPAIAKKEEALHKDVDHDGEKGESPAHQAKVFGRVFGKAPAKGGILFPKPGAKKADGDDKKPNPFGGKQAKPFGSK